MKDFCLINYLIYCQQNKFLLEYELVNLTTESSTSLQGMDNNSYILVSYHLERIYGYHILNSFFPSLLMSLVSYSTFYFQVTRKLGICNFCLEYKLCTFKFGIRFGINQVHCIVSKNLNFNYTIFFAD